MDPGGSYVRPHPVQPLIFAPAGRTIASLPRLGAGDALDVRRVEVLPHGEELDPDRPTVVLVDAALALRSGGPGMLGSLAPYAAFVGLGEEGEQEQIGRAHV